MKLKVLVETKYELKKIVLFLKDGMYLQIQVFISLIGTVSH